MNQELLTSFREYLNQYCLQSDHCWMAFSNRLNHVILPKGAILTQLGEVEDKIYFVRDGIVREYVEFEGREFSIDFVFENGFTSSITSYLKRSPSQYCLTTQVPTELISISHSELTWLYENFAEINIIGRKLTEFLLIEKRQRELDLLTISAEDRYLNLLSQHPKYLQHIPLKHLASFLGVTAESLSRIRAKRGLQSDPISEFEKQ